MIRLVLLFIFLGSGSAWSAPISVRSGEHDEFTRLVVYLQENAKWSLSETQDNATLTVENWTEGFDISQVYSKVGTDRLRSLASSDGSLVISLGCECRVNAKELKGGFISLDIRERTLRRPSARPVFEAKQQTLDVESPPTASIDENDYIELPIVFERPSKIASLDRILESLDQSPEDHFEGSLGKEIARSASLTYLQPSGAELQSNRPASPRPGTKSQVELLAELSSRARFLNAGSRPGAISTDLERSCPDPDDYAVSNWGTDQSFSDQLADLRSNFYSEFDTVNRPAVRDLARFYVHFGLVEEARQVSENFEDYSDLMDLLELANVISTASTIDQDRSNFSKCGGETGFWSILAEDDPKNLSEDLAQEQISVFQSLPSHLQELTADRFVGLLSQAGHLTGAAIVRSIIRRSDAPDERSEKSEPLDFELELLSQDRLLEIVEANNQSSPEALAFYLENTAETNTAAPLEYVELAAAFSKQLDGTETARRLLSGHILTLAGLGESVAAMAVFFSSEAEKLDDPVGLREKLLKKIRVLEDPADVSKFVWVLNERDMLGNVSKEELLEAAKFLSEYGQPQLASVLLNNVQSSPEVDSVLASTFALSGDREKAANLISRTSEDAIDPRLSQVILSQDPAMAWQLRERLSGPASERAAWVSKSWGSVPPSDAGFEASDLLARTQDIVERPGKPIQDAQVAFSDSKNARRILGELLN